MFKNRHIQVKLVKDTKTEPETTLPTITREDIDRMIDNGIKKVVIGAVVIGAAFAVLNTASQIAVKKTAEAKND